MTPLFRLCADYVIDRLEGGSAVISDSGGLTRWGISKKAHPELDIENLTRDEALVIYYNDYWEKPNIEILSPLPPLALMIFDTGVNMHPPVAIRFLQDILRVKGDGILGPKTAAAAYSYQPPYELRVHYSETRLRYYEDLARSKPYFYRYLHGWRMRCFRVSDRAGQWEGGDVGVVVGG